MPRTLHFRKPHMVTFEQASLFASNWIAAWNARDLEHVLSHYSEDVTFVSPLAVALAAAPEGIVRGLPALRRYFQGGLDAYPELHFEPIAALVGVNSIALHYRSVGERTAIEVFELDASGRISRATAHYTPATKGHHMTLDEQISDTEGEQT